MLPAQDEAKPGLQGSWSQWSCPCWLVIYSSKNSDCTTAPVLAGLYTTQAVTVFSPKLQKCCSEQLCSKSWACLSWAMCVTGTTLPKHKAFSAYVSTSVYAAIPPNYWSITAKLAEIKYISQINLLANGYLFSLVCWFFFPRFPQIWKRNQQTWMLPQACYLSCNAKWTMKGLQEMKDHKYRWLCLHNFIKKILLIYKYWHTSIQTTNRPFLSSRKVECQKSVWET